MAANGHALLSVGPELPPSVDDPIVALATPWGESALAVIRAAGAGCIGLASGLFRGARPLEQLPDRTLAHGHITDPASGEIVDEVLIWVQREGGGYTGQDAVEVSCHGGPAVLTRLLDLFHRSGFRAAARGEFTLRAFRSGRMDLTRAEAVNELIRAQGDRARQLALARLGGSVSERVEAVTRSLLALAASLELRLDYPEDEIDEPPPEPEVLESLRRDVVKLLSTYATGRLVQEGARVVITGRANAGKSTLFNRLLREDRAIVSPQPGTTRDYLEAGLSLRGYALRLYDTAGLRTGNDELEIEGIRRTRALLEAADLAVYVVDAGVGETPEDVAALSGLNPDRVVRVWTKTDRVPTKPPTGYVSCSGVTGEGIERLGDALVERLYGGLASADLGAVLSSDRQRLHLQKARDALERARDALAGAVTLDLVSVDVREALDQLGAITGRVTTADVLAEMFSRFCVGK